MIRSFLVLLTVFTVLLATATAFRPASLTPRRGVSQLQVAFDEYVMGETTTLAFQDTMVGDGDRTAQDGDVLTVAFKGTVMQTGNSFAKNDDFVFALGQGQALPGFDKALPNVQVGTTRVIRVPPNMAFGERGASSVPPNADLEIEVEVKGVARGAVEGVLAKIGTFRLITGTVLLGFLAISPFLG